MSIKYWAITSWNGEHWDVRIEDYDGRHRGDTTADCLAYVSRNAGAILAFDFGVHPDLLEVGFETRLPEPVEAALSAAEGFVLSAAACLEGVNTSLRQARVPEADIATLLAARTLDATASKQPT